MDLQTKGEGQGCRSLPGMGSRAAAGSMAFLLPQAPDKHHRSAFDHRFVGRFWVTGQVGSPLTVEEYMLGDASRQIFASQCSLAAA